MRLSETGDSSSIVGVRVDEAEEIPGRGYTRVDRQALSFQVALPPGALDAQGQVRGEAAQVRAIGQKMHEFIAATGQRYREPLRIDALPKSSSYRQLLAEEHGFSLDEGYMAALKAAVARRWQRNASPKSQIGLQ